ncbi:MAG: PHP domain-containing protein, partial [Bacillota bacterium]
MSKPYIHLHVHTEYSMLDGAAKIDKLVQAAKEAGAPAIGLTDHGNMYGTIKLYDACKAAGIKPVLGCEFYTTSDMTIKEHMINGRKARLNHLVLLAKNNIGFDNISKMCSLAWTEGFYHKPRIDLELLKKHSEGIICLSACLAGVIPQMLLNNDYEGAKNYAIELRDMFDEGDFYIELQNHGIEEQLQTNPLLVKIAREIGVKCVATNDVHYIKKSDADMHDIMLCMQTGSYYDDPDRMRFSCEEFYYKSADEMREVLGWCEESLETPYEIAEKCDVKFVFNEYQLPEYNCPDNLTPPEYLRKLAYEGLERRYGTIPAEYIERAEMELNVIISMGFSEYYLIVWDFINWSRLHDIPVG